MHCICLFRRMFCSLSLSLFFVLWNKGNYLVFFHARLKRKRHSILFEINYVWTNVQHVVCSRRLWAKFPSCIPKLISGSHSQLIQLQTVSNSENMSMCVTLTDGTGHQVLRYQQKIINYHPPTCLCENTLSILRRVLLSSFNVDMNRRRQWPKYPQTVSHLSVWTHCCAPIHSRWRQILHVGSPQCLCARLF